MHNLSLSQHIAFLLCEKYSWLKETSLGNVYNNTCKNNSEVRFMKMMNSVLNNTEMTSRKYDRIVKKIKRLRVNKIQKQSLFIIAFIVRENCAAKTLYDSNEEVIGQLRKHNTELSKENDTLSGRTLSFQSNMNVSFGRAMDLYISIFKYYGQIDQIKLKRIKEYIKDGLSDYEIKCKTVA